MNLFCEGISLEERTVLRCWSGSEVKDVRVKFHAWKELQYNPLTHFLSIRRSQKQNKTKANVFFLFLCECMSRQGFRLCLFIYL